MNRINHIIKTLRNTNIEHPIDGDEVDEWVDRLTNLRGEIEHTRAKADPTLLTEREAETLIRHYGMGQSVDEIAEALGVSKQRVYDLRYAVEDDLLAADATLSVIDELRREISPKPYDTKTPHTTSTKQEDDNGS